MDDKKNPKGYFELIDLIDNVDDKIFPKKLKSINSTSTVNTEKSQKRYFE